jgi:ribosomal protein L37E
VIFDIVEYIIMEWTMPNESRICRICRRGAYPKKKKRSVAGQFAAVKYRSETYCWTKKLDREDFFFYLGLKLD